MYCPFCHAEETKVVDSRLVADGAQVRRRRECLECHERFTTFETAELIMPLIIKRDGRREPFHIDNLRSGMLRAWRKDLSALMIWKKLLFLSLRKFEEEVNARSIPRWLASW